MDRSQVITASGEIIKTWNLYTGWPIPTGKGYEDLISLFAAELKNEYGHLTVSEVILALKKKSHLVNKEYTLPLSIILFHQVMNHYADIRGLAMEHEDKLCNFSAQTKLLEKEQIEQLEYQNAEEAYQAYKDGTYDPLSSASGAFVFDTLFKSNFIDTALLNEFFGRGISSLRRQLEKEKSTLLLTADNTKNINAAKAAKIGEKIALIVQIESDSKKYALKYVFDFAIKNKLPNFYVKD